jgi:hypothetical protein
VGDGTTSVIILAGELLQVRNNVLFRLCRTLLTVHGGRPNWSELLCLCFVFSVVVFGRGVCWGGWGARRMRRWETAQPV